MNNQISRKILSELLKSQKFAVIATQGIKEPYTNLVSFVSTNDMRNIIFATSKKTKKFENIKRNSCISVLIDNRDNTESDIQKAIVITGIGTADEIKEKNDFYKELYLKKHPYLLDFVNSEDSVLIKIKIDKYIVVNKFENVEIIDLQKL